MEAPLGDQQVGDLADVVECPPQAIDQPPLGATREERAQKLDRVAQPLQAPACAVLLLGRRRGEAVRAGHRLLPAARQHAPRRIAQRRHGRAVRRRRCQRERKRDRLEHEGREHALAHDVGCRLDGRRCRQHDLRGAGRRERRQQRRREHVVVARPAQPRERLAPARLERCSLSRIGGPATEHAQRRAQAPDRHAQLVQVLGVGTRIGHLGGIRQQLPDDADHDRGEGRARRRAQVERRRDRAHRCRRALPARQPMSAFGLGADVQPQPVPLGPACRQRQQGLRRAGDELELDLPHRQHVVAGADRSLVERDLDDGTGVAQQAMRAPDLGAVERAQRGAVGEQRDQALADRGAGVTRGVDRRLAALPGQRHLVLGPPEQPVGAALEGLHPGRALLAQPQREPARREAVVVGLGIDRREPRDPGPPRRHRPAHGGERARWHLELELGLDGGHARRPTRRWRPADLLPQTAARKGAR